MAYPYAKKTYREGKVTQYTVSGDLTGASTTAIINVPPGAYYLSGVLRGNANNKALAASLKSLISSTQTGTNVSATGLYICTEGGASAPGAALPINAGVSAVALKYIPATDVSEGGSVVVSHYGFQLTVSSTIGTGSWEFDLTATEV